MPLAGNTRVYVGAESHGLYRLSPGAEQWEVLTNGLPERVQVQGIALHPDKPEVVFAGRTGGPTAAPMPETTGSAWTTPPTAPESGPSCSAPATPA